LHLASDLCIEILFEKIFCGDGEEDRAVAVQGRGEEDRTPANLLAQVTRRDPFSQLLLCKVYQAFARIDFTPGVLCEGDADRIA
jgi:hypothetical protein